MVLVFLIPLLVIVGYCSYWVATHGRKMTLPEEVTKGIKSDTPFPSPRSSNNNSKADTYNNQISNPNSSIININETQYIPSDFVPNESTYVVRREFVPKSVDELPIKRKQILTVKEIYEDGWCMAISISTGEMGVVPYQCLIKYNDLLKLKRKLKKKQKQQRSRGLSNSNSSRDNQYFQPCTTPQLIFNDNTDNNTNDNNNDNNKNNNDKNTDKDNSSNNNDLN